MDFDLTDEQRLLSDSVTRLLADRYGFEARKGYLKQPGGWSTELWAQYAELGLLGLPFAEEHGGFGQVFLALLEAVLVGDQAIDAFLQQALFVGQVEIHQSLSTALERIFFCISLVPP